MNAVVVYDNIKDKELLDKINLGVPFFIDYINLNTKNGRKQGFQIKSHWGAKLNPFIELYDGKEIIKVFYSEAGNACNQLISYLNSNSMIVKIKKLNENAVIPFQKHPGEDACYDLVATSCKYNREKDRFEYGLGFATEFTPLWEAEIRPRSTNTKKEFYIPNAPGTIDSNYRGEWFVMFKHRVPFEILFPTGDEEENIKKMEALAPYKIGEAVAQVKINKVELVDWIEVQELTDTSRGTDGGLVRK